MGIGELFALGSAIVWAVAVIMFTRIGDRLPAFELNFIKNLIGFILLSITALLFEGLGLPSMSWTEWAILIFSGVIGIAVADTLYMQALNTIGAGSTGVVAALYSPFVVIISVFYLGEALSLWQIIGLLFVLSGVMLISLDKPIKALTPKQLLLGISLGALSVFLTALGVVIVKPIIETQPFFWSSGLRLFAGIIGMMLYLSLLGRWQRFAQHLKGQHHWGSIIISSTLGAYVAMTLWLAGYKYTDASIAAILNETTSIFIVLLAWLWLKENMSRKKVFGIGFAISGVLLVVTQ